MTGNSFHQQWDLNSHHSAAPPPPDTLAASQNILESLKKRRGAETAQWMNNLNNEVGQNLPTVSQQNLNSVSPEQRCKLELVRWLDKLFDQFEVYSARFNSAAEGTDLLVTCKRPSIDAARKTKQVGLYDDPEEVKTSENTLEGHLVTRFWAMYLKAGAGKVSVFIFPAEALLGFSLHRIDESVYSPLLVIESECSTDKLVWHIAGTNIVINQVPMLAKELFGDLIRVASGQMSETELFAHPLQEMNLGENLAVGYKVPPQNTATPQQSVPAVSETAMASPNKGPFALSSLPLAQPMLSSIEADIAQLFQLGKTALAADDTIAFKNIKALTEKMETLKATLNDSFSEIARITHADATNKDN